MIRRSANSFLVSAKDFASRTPIRYIPYLDSIYNFLVTHTIPSGPRWANYKGYEIYLNPADDVSRDIYLGNEPEPAVFQCMRDNITEGDLVIDIGGFVGSHMIEARKLCGSDGLVIVFEPHPRNSRYLRKTIDKNSFENIDVEQKAVADTNSTRDLFENISSGDPSGSSVREVRSNEVATDIYTVETVTLPSFMESRCIEEVDFLKMDIEGGEYEAIKGMEPVLSHINKMLIEIHPLSRSKSEFLARVLTESGIVKILESGTETSRTDLERELSTGGDHVYWERHEN